MRTTLTGIFALAAGLVLARPAFGQTVGDITGSVTDVSTRLGGDRANQSFAVSGSRREYNISSLRSGIDMRELQFSLKVVF